ncbi:MAG: Rrf2 family transcriptional regulator [Nitrosomonadaceae bacterium]|jgi:Rrf2 family protein
MILSRTTQYAIQALIYMATQPRGAAILNRNIAESLGAPPTYLAKVLQNLCRGNLLYSYRGKQGGFCLQENGEKITLMQIVIITEGPGFTKDCVLGLKICNDKAPCPMHKQWYPIKTEIVKLLESQTLDILSAAVMSGKYQLADLPAALMGELKSRT